MALQTYQPVEAGVTSWAGNTEVTDISGGEAHSCAVAGGKAYCWGSGADGRLGHNSTSSSSVPVAVRDTGALSGKTVTVISAGASHSCAVADAGAYCWGAGTSGKLGNNGTSSSNVPVTVSVAGVLSGKTVTDIAAGANHTCAVADGAAYCWGAGADGRLGNNSTSNSQVPVAVNVAGVLAGRNVTAISAGDAHSCAIADGLAFCWGLGTSGRLGNSSTSSSSVPVAVNTGGVLSGKNITDISAGVSHSCAVADGLAFCWGSGANGRMGHNNTTSSNVPVAVNTGGVLGGKIVTGISAGSSHSCATASGAAYCWGQGSNGRLGNNDDTQSNVPVAVNTAGTLSGKTVVMTVVGNSHSCAIASNQAYCWGFGTDGRLGHNDTVGSLAPVAVQSLTTPLRASPYRFYENIDSATPGSALAGIDSAPKLSGPNSAFRLRQGINNGIGFTAISSGNSHSCAIASGKAYCWGQGANGRLGNNSTADSLVPAAVDTSGVLAGKTVTSISAGSGFTCAVADGAAYCWGYGNGGRLGDNSSSDSPVPVAVNTAGVLNGKTVTAISAGIDHSCAVANGAAFCWGLGVDGRLGNNSTANSPVPVAVNTAGVLNGKTVTAISAGIDHSCAVADGAAYCWGAGGNGRLGNNGTAQSNIPVAVNTAGVLNGKTVAAISAGDTHSCVVASGEGFCWGQATNGRLGNGATSGNQLVPAAVSTAGVLNGKVVAAISAGNTHSCAVANGEAFCWGNGTDGRLGNNTTSGTYSTPVAVNVAGVLGGRSTATISTSSAHTCTIADYEVYCWGAGGNGRLGNNSAVSSSVPVAISTSGPLSDKKITAISTGTSHSCAVADGAAYCWGLGTNGRLGNNSTTSSQIPVAVDTSGVLSGRTVTAIAAGDAHTCAVADSLAFCWGLGTSGRLGHNSTGSSNVPVAVNAAGVLSGKTVTAISAGTSHSCAVASAVAICWGLGTDGRLGHNSAGSSNVPVAVNVAGVLSGKTITAIAAGDAHSCAIGSGEAFCWGLGTSGRLGHNSTGSSNVPVAVNTAGVLNGKTVTAISAGTSHTCAVASAIATCWGVGTSGRLGNNGTSSSSVPVAVDTAGVLASKTVTAISAGNAHSCAVAANAAYCWGLGGNGRLGNNDTTQSNVPVAVYNSGVTSGKTTVTITAGNAQSCIIASSAAYCWGIGTDGVLGNNGASSSTIPVAVYTNIPPAFLGSTILAGMDTYVLQYATLSAATCSAQTTGFAAVTASTPIAFNTNAGVANGAAITTNSNDPTGTAATVAQSYRSSDGTFTTANNIPPGQTGLFDFSLKDNRATANTTFCLRIAYSGGTVLENASAYAAITTANGILTIDVVNIGMVVIPSPSFPMSTAITQSTCQSVTGMFATSSERIRVFNSLSATGWSINVAATSGPTAAWSSGGSSYDFNDPSGSPSGCNSGSDGDGIAGRLTLDPSGSALSTEVGCSFTGLSKGGVASFSQGVIDAITLLAASSSTPTGCYYLLHSNAMQQYIPAFQPAGSYSISMTVTVVAQ